MIAFSVSPMVRLHLFMRLFVIGSTTEAPSMWSDFHWGACTQIERGLSAAARLAGGLSIFDDVTLYMHDVFRWLPV